jgi:CheY-like chemotaxis protein
MDGFEFHRLKQTDPVLQHIPTIFMSADHQLETKIAKSKYEEILNKPVDLDALLNAIETYIAM